MAILKVKNRAIMHYKGINTTNIKDEYAGRFLFCLMGIGKSYIEDPDIVDTDKIYAALLKCKVKEIFGRIKKDNALAINALKIIKGEIKKGKTVLTGSFLLGKYCNFAFIYGSPQLLQKRLLGKDRENKRYISIWRAQERTGVFKSICNDNNIDIMDIGNSYLSEHILK